MSRAVLSIGSNVGASLGHLRSVIERLGAAATAVSPVYRSAPWGGVEQQDFLNAVVVAEDSDRDPRDWLEFARECEQAADRVRVERWGPRSLDVDIVVCDRVVSQDPELTLPHPRAHLRAFVLVPWLTVDASATLAVGDEVRAVHSWLDALPEEEKLSVVRTDMTLDTPE